MPDRITVYTLAELKENFPEAYARVLERWQNCQDEIPWSEETMQSLREVISACGGSLDDWSVGAYSQNNYLRVSVPDEYDRAWFLHNVLKPNGYTRGNGHAYFPGLCKFTGYCADDNFLEATWGRLNAGDTLKDALESLADVAGNMFEDNLEQAQNEDSMEANWGDNQYTEDGTEV